MSTRSAIVEKTETGYRGIYCHLNGSPSDNGRLLATHYTDPSKVRALIDLGDISVLGREVVPTAAHSYDKPQENVTVAYARDRNETGTEPISGKTIKSVTSNIDHEYAYVFNGTTWSVNGRKLDAMLIKLESQ